MSAHYSSLNLAVYWRVLPGVVEPSFNPQPEARIEPVFTRWINI